MVPNIRCPPSGSYAGGPTDRPQRPRAVSARATSVVLLLLLLLLLFIIAISPPRRNGRDNVAD